MALPAPGTAGLEIGEAKALLERVARMIDQLSEALPRGSYDDSFALQLGDASHGVYRALVALGACATDWD